MFVGMGCEMGEANAAAVADFPNGESLQAFLRQVQLWNCVDGLPRVETDACHDRVRVQVRTVASAQKGILRLVEAFGGRFSEGFRSA